MSSTDSPYYWLNPAYKRVSSQKEIIIGIQGGVGSFNEEAIRRYFKENNCSNYTIKYLYTTKNVLEALRKNEIDVGQFAFSNSIAGVVEESVKAMKDLEFEVIDYYTIKIQHALMTRNDIEFCEVKRILTHPVVLLQCKENLKKKYSRLEQQSGDGLLIDQAMVAQKIMSGELPKDVATIGSKSLSEICGLKIIEDNLQDRQDNYTTFLHVISH